MSKVLLVTMLMLSMGCTEENEFASLYDPPSGASTPALFGSWGGARGANDIRWVLAPNQATLATRCGETIVGVVVAAEISATGIRLLESKEAGTEACFIRSTPGTIAACPTDVLMPKKDCFVHNMKQLTLYATNTEFIELTKLED